MPDELYVVLADEPAARHRMQSADVILREFGTPDEGWRWTIAVLADYPGCLVAVAHDPDGHWCVPNIRGFGGLFVQARSTPLDRASVDAVAILSYQDRVRGGTGRLPSRIEARCPAVVVRATCRADTGGGLSR
jgi:hypothetical protein